MNTATGIEIRLNAGQLARLRDIVNDKQDGLFEKLQSDVAKLNHGRAEGLRQGLKFWDEIERELSRVANIAAESEDDR